MAKKLVRGLLGTGPGWPSCPECGGYCDLRPGVSTRSECVPVDLVHGFTCPEHEARMEEYRAERKEYLERSGGR